MRATPSPAVLFGPTTVPSDYAFDGVRYILRPPSGIAANDPALRIRWILEDRNAGTVLVDSDGPAHGRLRFDFVPGSFAATDFGVVARLYRQLGVDGDRARDAVGERAHAVFSAARGVRPVAVAGSRIRRSRVDEATDTWSYTGDIQVNRWSEWHRTDQPCLAVNADARYRFEVETADRLPFSLRLIENHRKGMCPYCFYGGPAGISADLEVTSEAEGGERSRSVPTRHLVATSEGASRDWFGSRTWWLSWRFGCGTPARPRRRR